MKKYLFILPLLLCLLPSLTRAQEQKNRFSLSIGRQATLMLDEQASPLIYKASALQAELAYERRRQQSRFGVEISPAIGENLPERFGARLYGNENFSYTVASAYYSLEGQIRYLRLLNKVGSKLKLFAGGAIHNSLGISDGNANFYAGTNILAVEAQGQLEYTPQEKHLLALRLGVPVVAAVTRHVYANYPKSADYNNLNAFFRQGTKLALPDELQRVKAQLNYHYSLSQRLVLGANYQFSWFHYPEPRPVCAYSQALSLQTILEF